MNDYLFDHEKLHVYQKALQFVVWQNVMLTGIEKKHAVVDQLDRASTSIVLNIAGGNGKSTAKDRCKYFDIARGSALECAAGLDTLAAKELLSKEGVMPGKQVLHEIVSMLVGLIKSNSDRLHEKSEEYNYD